MKDTYIQLRGLLWRIHFWAALIASPIAAVAALSGMLFIFTPQVERGLYSHLDTVEPLEIRRPLDDIVQAANKAAPTGWTLHSVMPPSTVTESARVAFVRRAPPRATPDQHAGHGGGEERNNAGSGAQKFLRPNFGIPNQALVIYVDPYSAQVLGSLPQSERFNVWARKLHSNYLQNDRWRWIVELAASWMMVMLVTGVYLWWPRGRGLGLPQAGAKGRVAWKQWHAVAGVGLGLMSAAILVTGLTWSKNAGEQIRWLRDATGQQSPRIPANFRSTPTQDKRPLTWEQAFDAIRSEAPDVAMQIMPPVGQEGFWRANQIDRGQPERGFDLLVDAYTGRTLYSSGWDQQTAFGKATAIGIPFHRGEFGLWNQALLLMFGAGVVFSIVSGWVMYLKRGIQGYAGLPKYAPGAWKCIPPGAWLGAGAMLVAMPLLAISAVPVLMIEAAFAWKRRSG